MIYIYIYFFADECPNSADDSDDDVITDYLVSCDGTGPPMASKHGGPGPLVPTISVTPHSPGAKHYPVLGEYSFFIPSHMSCKPFVNKTVPHSIPCNTVEQNGLHYVILNMCVVWYSEQNPVFLRLFVILDDKAGKHLHSWVQYKEFWAASSVA